VHRLAKHLRQPDRDVFERHVDAGRAAQSGLFVLQKVGTGTCPLLGGDDRCSVHAAKPKACRLHLCTAAGGQDRPIAPDASADPNAIAEIWEQSLAAAVTKAYAANHGARWNEPDYYKAIVAIYDNVVTSDRQKIKLARNGCGAPLGMIYDCSQCDRRGTYATETPITLDDIRRIARHLRMSLGAFFEQKIAPEPSGTTGGLKLVRAERCVFFDVERHCTIRDVRPMHCRFTPCPRQAESEEAKTCLFLGSGTLEEQFRHHVALAATRRYVEKCGTGFSGRSMKKLLDEIDQLATDDGEFMAFRQRIAPFRYMDDDLAL
jgi:Fe-S-cluster containining protein